MLGPSETSMQLPPKQCPECGEEYVHSVQLCPECGVTLVLAGAPIPQADDRELPSASELVRVRTATLAWAYSFSDLLADEGIPHRIEAEDDRVKVAGARSGEQVCSVYVLPEDRERAAQLDAQHLRTQIPDVPEDRGDIVPAEDRCPACGEPADLDAAECASCGLAFRDADN
jgi:hypothetical protein